jgi:hypothetical protein
MVNKLIECMPDRLLILSGERFSFYGSVKIDFIGLAHSFFNQESVFAAKLCESE